ncbi:uncharacterized protein N7498_002240 [Penicillium cinerascens]|uniref:PNPLA domain-containing protein n=1 Tax=Penicillium cinerascens TaxID=70096 RepID=A0A9W9N9M4_9EURO|nr:uncharacterized protein N7498_002240 [Penicillium cinerascens]KAJ5215833.1 hypothetical protein N7498_002240 [Penicillium cinerascens]
MTAGSLELVGIDGGGARGVTLLEFMAQLQKLLGNCQIYSMIDLAVGTSFVFEALARRCFSRSKSISGRIKSMLHYVTTDAMYDESFLEESLQEILKDCKLFRYIPGIISGTKVALTATSTGNKRSIFTNYNRASLPII